MAEHLWLIPVALIGLGVYLNATDKGYVGSYITLPSERGVGGCLLVLLTIAAVIGYFVARLFS